MHQFTDTAGRAWDVALNVTTWQRLRELERVDLLTILDRDSLLLAELHRDPARIRDVVYCLCQAQAEARGLNRDQFGEGLAGAALAAATGALLDETADFFPDGRGRLMRAILARIQAAEKATADVLEAIATQPPPAPTTSN